VTIGKVAPLSYLSDQETKVDLLNNEAIAKTIVRLIGETVDSAVTIGVHGDWGAGKSSVLEMVEAERPTRILAHAISEADREAGRRASGGRRKRASNGDARPGRPDATRLLGRQAAGAWCRRRADRPLDPDRAAVGDPAPRPASVLQSLRPHRRSSKSRRREAVRIRGRLEGRRTSTTERHVPAAHRSI
jgi:KAP family P-loop domain